MTTSTTKPSDSTTPSTEERPYKLCSVILFTTVPWLADMLYGFDCGAISYAILQLDDEEMSGVTWGYKLSATMIGMIVSAAALGAFLASSWIVREKPSQDCTRKQIGYVTELQIGAGLYLVGAALQASCRWMSHFGFAIATLLAGRLVYGMGIGVSMHAAPAYLGEMSPSDIRGFCLAMKEAANTVGVLVGYQVGHYLSAWQGGWAYSFMISTFFSLTSLIISLWLPDSARWLLLHDKDQDAKESLKFLYCVTEIVEMEFNEIKQHLMQKREQQQGKLSPTTTTRNELVCLWDKSNSRALIIGVGIIALQQFTGSPAMLAYASTVFEEAGQASNSSVHMAMFQLLVTLIAVGLVDRCGRRILLLLGCGAMALALAVLVVTYGWYDKLVLLAMFAYIGGFQLGFGPIAWLVVAEVFSNELRAKATALCVQTNFLTYGFVQFAVPVVTAAFGFNGTFAAFGILSAYSVYFVYAFVPETSGMTLEAIETKMEQSGDKGPKQEAHVALLDDSSDLGGKNQHNYGSILV